MSQDNKHPRQAPIPPEAHGRLDRIDVWRFWAPILTIVLLVAWRAADHFSFAAAGSAWHAPGPVATPHATWEANCAACHESWAPISGFHWLGMGGLTNHRADAQCKTCHAGPDHHAAEAPSDRSGCTSCHREHRGREASLLRVPDDQCTRCHANIKGHLDEAKHTEFLDVTRFDHDRTGHPEFRVLREKVSDPGRLKFNHKRHMTEGMRLAKESEPFTLAKIDMQFRDFFRLSKDQRDDDAVTLTCASCHRRDSSDLAFVPGQLDGLPLDAVTPVRAPGAAMLPIVYEKHCQACHPLTFERRERDNPRSGHVTVRHRLQPEAIRMFLEAHYTAELLRGKGPVVSRPLTPLPGKGIEPEAQRALDAIGEHVVRAEHELYLGKKTCGECHHWQPSAHKLPPNRFVELRVEPTVVKQIWLEHAIFNHAAHRLLECRACHADAYAQDETGDPNPHASVDSKDILLPGIGTCVECHSPPRQGGKARHDCVECHRYHDGDHALKGKGSAARAGDEAGKRTIRQFLDNSPQRSQRSQRKDRNE